MVEQENDQYLDDKWLIANYRLIGFSKNKEQIVGRIKRLDLPYVQGPQYWEGNLVVMEKDLISTEKPPIREPGTNGNHAHVCQAVNDSYSANNPRNPGLNGKCTLLGD